MDFTKFIDVSPLVNTDEGGVLQDFSITGTKDLVYLNARTDFYSDYALGVRFAYPTDYAVMNMAGLSHKARGPLIRKTCYAWMRSAYDADNVDYIGVDGAVDHCDIDEEYLGLCPAMHLNLKNVLLAKSASSDFFKISDKKIGDKTIHLISFGEYPKTYVGDKVNRAITDLFNAGGLRETGKIYIGALKIDDEYPNIHYNNIEYQFMGGKYVRVLATGCDNDSELSDGTKLTENAEYLWVRVEPINFVIRNWEELPTEINPDGNGKAKFIDIRSEEAIMAGMPFYEAWHDNKNMWQNSQVRAFLNGYNIHEEIKKGNGNTECIAKMNYDFTKMNFLKEAFAGEFTKMLGLIGDKIKDDDKSTDGYFVDGYYINNYGEKIKMSEENKEKKHNRKSRLEKLNPDTSLENSRRKMTDTEIIKTWVDAGQSVLLRGPSGIGKTERIKKLYPDLIYIKLTNNMFPEKVVGSINLQTGESVPPDFAKQALMACATDDERKLIKENIQNLYDLADTIYERSKNSKNKTVIMLDELLNVKPAVQALVYTLVLNKIVETGKGLKLPANTVVVATGNQKKYSQVAEDLAEPLEKRFDHILDMEPKVSEWIYEYAIPNKIHPTVIGYIFSKYQENGRKEDLENIGYFYEEPEVGEENLDKNGCRGKTNDPRGWASISNTLYNFEEDLKNGKFVGKNVEDLLKVTISSKLREEWAEEFFDFYNHPVLTVEEVVNKKYTQADLPQDVNEKFAVIASLMSANEKQVQECREFIKKHCAPEYLSVYDLYWASNDEKRMEKLFELQNETLESLKED